MRQLQIYPKKIWSDYEKGKNYKSGENLYNITARNERYYASDQWNGVRSNGLPTPVFNFLEQLVDVKISSVMANQLTIHRRADELSEDNETVVNAAKAFTEQDKKNWEHFKMDNLNEQLLLDSAISGLGISYWYWDETIERGNDFRTKGDIKGELIDSINLYVSNPNECDIQKQEWIIIPLRRTIKQVKEEAKKNGIDIEIDTIKGDEETTYEAFDKAQKEQESSVTVLVKMWKENENIYFCKTTAEAVIKPKTNTELTRYPIAMMPWKPRKRFIYGTAEITHIISNQQHVNKMEAMRQLHAQLMSIPKVGVNKNMIEGFSNQIGGIIPVNAQPQENISNAIHYFQPTQITLDVDKSIDSTITLTREFKGINDNVIGASSPENYSAILAQQKAAGVPLESIKRRFHQYLEDVALIWLDFYQHKYKLARRLKTEEGEILEYTGTDYQDIYLRTSIDVGASTQYSELISMEVLDRLRERDDINIVQYLKRYPKNIIPEQQKLIEEKEAELGMSSQEQNSNNQQYNQMGQLLESLSPEQQQEILNLSPEQQQDILTKLTIQNPM